MAAKRLLLTRSRHDLLNEYLYAYCEDVISEARSLGWQVDRMEDADNNSSQLRSRLSKSSYHFVFFNGHGNCDCVCGDANKEIITTAEGGLLSRSISYARSCDALTTLGKEAVVQGCLAFIGYRTSFLLPYTNEYALTPLKDPAARPVIEISNIVPKLILKGATVQKAVESARSKSGEMLIKMLGSSEPLDSAVFRALYHNHDALSFEGNPNSCV